MAIINFGSMNLDLVYTMPRFVLPGETVSAEDYQCYCGGKGLNQSVAASLAGARVLHAGMLGEGGEMLRDFLENSGVNTEMLGRTPVAQGRAIIQVSHSGENSIILYHGSNYAVTEAYIDSVFRTVEHGSYLMLQNEVSGLSRIIDRACQAGCLVVLNPSPFEESLREIDLKKLSWLVLNEIEAAEMTGCQDPEAALHTLRESASELGIVLTLGSRGSLCAKGSQLIRQKSFPVKAVDTTGAGDTFTGYFIAALDAGADLPGALRRASAAAAIAVTRKGAAPAIPTAAEVDSFIAEACLS